MELWLVALPLDWFLERIAALQGSPMYRRADRKIAVFPTTRHGLRPPPPPSFLVPYQDIVLEGHGWLFRSQGIHGRCIGTARYDTHFPGLGAKILEKERPR